MHGADLQYVFDNLSATHRGKKLPFNEQDQQVSNELASAWVNFAKSGDPNGGLIKGWRVFSSSNDEGFEFGKPPMVPTRECSP